MSAGTVVRLKWVQDAEAGLNPKQLEVWKAVHAQLSAGHPHVGTDFGLEIFLLTQIQHGVSAEALEKFIPKRHGDRRQADRRMLAAGDLELA